MALKWVYRGWKAGSAVRTHLLLLRGPGSILSTHSSSSQTPVTPGLGRLMPSCGLCRYQGYTLYIYLQECFFPKCFICVWMLLRRKMCAFSCLLLETFFLSSLNNFLKNYIMSLPKFQSWESRAAKYFPLPFCDQFLCF